MGCKYSSMPLCKWWFSWTLLITYTMGLLPDTQNCGLHMHRECRERFPPSLRVDDPDMHHGTCVTHVPWCMPGSLTSGFPWSRWQGKRSRHSWRMCNSQVYVSGKRPMADVAWQPLLRLLSQCPVKESSLQLIWRLGTCRLNLLVPDLRTSCSVLTERWGTRTVVPVMAARVTCPIISWALTRLCTQIPLWSTSGYPWDPVPMDKWPLPISPSALPIHLLQHVASQSAPHLHQWLPRTHQEHQILPSVLYSPFLPPSVQVACQVGSHHPPPKATEVAHPQDVVVVICNSPCCTPCMPPSRLWKDCTRFAPSRMCRCLQSVAWPSASVWRRCSGWLMAGCMYTRCCRLVCYYVRPARMSKLWIVCWNGW